MLNTFVKDLRTNWLFWAAAGLGHLIYAFDIAQFAALRAWHNEGLSQDEGRLAAIAAAFLVLAIPLIVQTDGLAEPLHDRRTRPITAPKVIAAKALAIGLFIILPRFLIDVISNLFLGLPTTDAGLAAFIHLSTDLPVVILVFAVATATRNIGQFIAGLGLVFGIFLISSFAAVAVVDSGDSWLTYELLWHGYDGDPSAPVGFFGLPLIGAAFLAWRCYRPNRAAVWIAPLAAFLILPPMTIASQFLPFFNPLAPERPETNASHRIKVSVDKLSSSVLNHVDYQAVVEHPDSPRRLLPIRLEGGGSDWLLFDFGNAYVKGQHHHSLKQPYYDVKDVTTRDTNPINHILSVSVPDDQLDRVDKLDINIRRYKLLGHRSFSNWKRFSAVPGGGACVIGWSGARYQKPDNTLNSIVCIGAIMAPCASLTVPPGNYCNLYGPSNLIRWPFSFNISYTETFGAIPHSAFFWRTARLFRTLELTPTDFQRMTVYQRGYNDHTSSLIGLGINIPYVLFDLSNAMTRSFSGTLSPYTARSSSGKLTKITGVARISIRRDAICNSIPGCDHASITFVKIFMDNKPITYTSTSYADKNGWELESTDSDGTVCKTKNTGTYPQTVKIGDHGLAELRHCSDKNSDQQRSWEVAPGKNGTADFTVFTDYKDQRNGSNTTTLLPDGAIKRVYYAYDDKDCQYALEFFPTTP